MYVVHSLLLINSYRLCKQFTDVMLDYTRIHTMYYIRQYLPKHLLTMYCTVLVTIFDICSLIIVLILIRTTIMHQIIIILIFHVILISTVATQNIGDSESRKVE